MKTIPLPALSARLMEQKLLTAYTFAAQPVSQRPDSPLCFRNRQTGPPDKIFQGSRSMAPEIIQGQLSQRLFSA